MVRRISSTQSSRNLNNSLENKNPQPDTETTSESVPGSEHIDSLLQQLDSIEVKIETKPEKKVSNEQLDNVVKDVARTYDVSQPIALAGVLCTLQAGGTSNNKRSNVKITIQGKGFESKTINAIITKHCKGITPRQFATHYANSIMNCAARFGITGNAYKYLKRHYPHMLTEIASNEIYWCSDFQINNDHCPEYIREALRQRYADKFMRKLKK